MMVTLSVSVTECLQLSPVASGIAGHPRNDIICDIDFQFDYVHRVIKSSSELEL